MRLKQGVTWSYKRYKIKGYFMLRWQSLVFHEGITLTCYSKLKTWVKSYPKKSDIPGLVCLLLKFLAQQTL